MIAQLAVSTIMVLGTVGWVRSERCGVVFERALEVAVLERLRSIADHERQYEQNSLSSAAAVWR